MMVLKVGVTGSIRYVEGQGLSFAFPAIPDHIALLVAATKNVKILLLPGGTAMLKPPGYSK